MSETLEYIDAYFNQELNDSQRNQFEAQCSNDENFAREVAFYMMARQSAREALLEQKQQQWSSTDTEVKETVVMTPVKKAIVLKWVPYAAAACVIFIIAGYFLFNQATPQRLATNYINQFEVSHTMDASHDSVQSGIDNYKNGRYQQALTFFEDVRKRDAKNSDAKIYAGMTYLKLNDYDKALQCFQELSAMTGLYSNSGDILQATTLLKRDKPGDERSAKELLEKVVRGNEEGSREAKEILNNW